MKKIKKYAFTLAETLIVIAIIGIVASLTIPSLIVKYQKEQTVLKLKKAYTELEQAISLSEIDNGKTSTWTYTLNIDVFMKKYIEPYFKKIKNDKTINLKDKNIVYKLRNGDRYTGAILNQGNYIVLSNGTMIFGDSWYSSNNNDRGLAVDINGYKGPNIIGRDLFWFNIYRYDGLKPLCYKEDKNYIDEECVSIGHCCQTKIIHDGWKIKDDYPW